MQFSLAFFSLLGHLLLMDDKPEPELTDAELNTAEEEFTGRALKGRTLEEHIRDTQERLRLLDREQHSATEPELINSISTDLAKYRQRLKDLEAQLGQRN